MTMPCEERELLQLLDVSVNDHTLKLVVSNPASPLTDVKKMVLERKADGFALSRYTLTQAFHARIEMDGARAFVLGALNEGYRQLNAWDDEYEHSLRLSKKGKPLYHRTKLEKPVTVSDSHDRTKRYLLPEGEIIQPLVDMGVFTKEGIVKSAMGDKYRQINRFLEFVEDEVKKLDPDKPLRIIDFGCGKSYLTFVLYHYLVRVRGLQVRMTGLDLKADVIARCNEAAQKYGYEGLTFEVGDIAAYQEDSPVDMVISLHACDTATDHALANALKWEARLIFCVPCCQHELAAQMKSAQLSLLTRYGIVKERAAALITDSLRAGLLSACGYHTQLLEFIELEHTPKNILIRARRGGVSDKERTQALDEARRTMDAFSLSPTLLRLLNDAGLLP